MYHNIFNTSLIFMLFPLFLLVVPGQNDMGFHGKSDTHEYGCRSGYKAFYKFQKVVNNPKYQCYGKPSGPAQEYYCPNHRLGKYGIGTCNGTYTKQEFCRNGKTTNLYYTASKCTCGCVDKNFHGHKLDILKLPGCGCDDDEKIGADPF